MKLEKTQTKQKTLRDLVTKLEPNLYPEDTPPMVFSYSETQAMCAIAARHAVDQFRKDFYRYFGRMPEELCVESYDGAFDPSDYAEDIQMDSQFIQYAYEKHKKPVTADDVLAQARENVLTKKQTDG